MDANNRDPSTQYWLQIDTTPSGPFTVEQIHAKLASGEISWNTSACLLGQSEWKPLTDTPGIGPAGENAANAVPPIPETMDATTKTSQPPSGLNSAPLTQPKSPAASLKSLFPPVKVPLSYPMVGGFVVGFLASRYVFRDSFAGFVLLTLVGATGGAVVAWLEAIQEHDASNTWASLPTSERTRLGMRWVVFGLIWIVAVALPVITRVYIERGMPPPIDPSKILFGSAPRSVRNTNAASAQNPTFKQAFLSDPPAGWKIDEQNVLPGWFFMTNEDGVTHAMIAASQLDTSLRERLEKEVDGIRDKHQNFKWIEDDKLKDETGEIYLGSFSATARGTALTWKYVFHSNKESVLMVMAFTPSSSLNEKRPIMDNLIAWFFPGPDGK